MAGSKFASILDAAGRTAAEPADLAGAPEPPPSMPYVPRRGRPNGKRSSSDYTQTTAYIRRETHSRVMMALSAAKYNGSGQTSDFSVLVDTLLSEWLKKQTLD
jgi:hypothetical protein